MADQLPSLLDSQTPVKVRAELAELSEAIDTQVPRKRDGQRNLLIGTWNIKDFGSLTEKWAAGAGDSPKRDWRALWAITEIVSRFDVIAIQEVTGDLKALRTLLKTLGRRWNFLMTDVTRGNAGGGERIAFLFDTARVELSGLAAELVVPREWQDEISPGTLREQFARTPYAVSFRAGSETFILATLHVKYGNVPADRVQELHAVARWMKEWAEQANRWHHNLLVLGDFNIDRRNDDLWRAFVSTGLTVPQALDNVRRSIFADPDDPQREKFYDQIAWFEDGHNRLLDMEFISAGGVDFVPHLYTDPQMTKQSLQYRMSDHYPLWVEFACRE